MRRVLEAHRAGRVDDMLQWMHAGVVWHPVTRPALSQYVGHAETRQMLRDVRAALGDYSLEVDDVVAREPSTVVARVRVLNEAGDLLSRVELTYVLRDGLVISVDSVALAEDS